MSDGEMMSRRSLIIQLEISTDEDDLYVLCSNAETEVVLAVHGKVSTPSKGSGKGRAPHQA